MTTHVDTRLCALCGARLETPQHSLFGMLVDGVYVARPADAHGFQERPAAPTSPWVGRARRGELAARARGTVR